MLLTRVLTAVVLIAVLLAVLFWLPVRVAQVAVAVVLLVGAWEWSAFARLAGALRRGAFVLTVAMLALLAWWMVPEGLHAILMLALLWWLCALACVVRYPIAVPSQLTALAGVAVLVPLWLVLLVLLALPADGRWMLLLLLVVVWAADIAAYFTGRAFGRVRLAPQVSPGKTWEGAIGGVTAAGVVAAAGAALLGLPVIAVAALGLAVATVSILGDLTVSLFKRNVGLKDSGQVFPGHGGVLDRIDSLAAAAPVYLFGLRWLEVWA